jgi:hypothetical protein
VRGPSSLRRERFRKRLAYLIHETVIIILRARGVSI